MCDFGVTEYLVIAGAVAAAGGAATTYVAGQNAASASVQAQSSAAASQNRAFMARMDAQRESTRQQSAVNTASAQRWAQNQSETQAAETAARTQRAQTISQINQDVQGTAERRDQAVDTAAAATPAIAQSQGLQQAQQQALTTPIVANIEASNPLGAAATGESRQALAAGQESAARYTQNYADTLARLSAYGAPSATAGQQAATLGTNLMPAAAMDAIYKTGTPALLAPSSVAYQGAGTYGRMVDASNQMLTGAGTTMVNAGLQNAIDLSNLTQSDDASIIQGQLNLAQQRASQLAGVGQGLSALGNTAMMYGASQGAFGAAAKAAGKVPSAQALLAAPSTTPAVPITWSIT